MIFAAFRQSGEAIRGLRQPSLMLSRKYANFHSWTYIQRNIVRHTDAVTTYLAKDKSIADYRRLVESQSKNEIVSLVEQRLTERYVTPMKVAKTKKNGFTTLAIACLLIEALESFHKGWGDTNRKSALAFCQFFDRNPEFLFLRGYASDFYRHVRCGILHQGETTGGWHVRRDGPVFDEARLQVNATKFHGAVTVALRNYVEELEANDWNSLVWKNLRKKMNTICKNCERPR